jgi:hypothetical protein
MYDAPATFREEFPQLFEGAFVEFRNLALMSWGEVRKMNGEMNGADEDARLQGVMARLVIEWNIPPLDAPKAPPLAVPVSAEDLDRVPSVVVARMMELSGILRPNQEAPKMSRSVRRSRGKAR